MHLHVLSTQDTVLDGAEVPTGSSQVRVVCDSINAQFPHTGSTFVWHSGSSIEDERNERIQIYLLGRGGTVPTLEYLFFKKKKK